MEVPYEIIKGYRKIAVYGAEKHGIDIVKRLKMENEFETVAWADQAYSDIETGISGISIISPEELLTINFDYVLIAIENYLIVRAVHSWLLSKDVPFEKIILLSIMEIYEEKDRNEDYRCDTSQI